MEQFSWIPMYREIAQEVHKYENRQHELITLITDMKNEGLKTIALTDKHVGDLRSDMTEIDPFTFFANFNMPTKDENRKDIIRFLKERWQLKADVPDDFNGIPTITPIKAWFVTYQKSREPEDIPLLWTIFMQALDNDIKEDTFNVALKIKGVQYNLTMGLFWIAPEHFLNLDGVNRKYLGKNGIHLDKQLSYQNYQACMKEATNKFGKKFYEISYDAWHQEQTKGDGGKQQDHKYWLFSAGRRGKLWEEFYESGFMAIGWDVLGDLRQYKSKKDIAMSLQNYDDDDKGTRVQNASMCYEFCNEMKVGDHIFAKAGMHKIVGWGIVTSDYFFDDTRSEYKHLRKVEWKGKGEWTTPDDHKIVSKTLTDITKYEGYPEYFEKLIGNSNGVRYWWLNANPNIWDFNALPLGGYELYTSKNEKGNKRRIQKYFQEIKPGDFILGYISSPERQVVALCKVTKGLHESKEGEAFEFEKIEQFNNPASLSHLQSFSELKDCEPLQNNQGSLFSLKPEEYEFILDIVKTENLYTKEQFLEETGVMPEMLVRWQTALEHKRQAVFYGPPGTGKTYIAERFARYLTSGSDGFSEVIQFHPAYSYEDFMEGLRPETDAQGNLHFKRQKGRFLEFCFEAQKRAGNCVLIIDELNRANIARVFGELMYLLEYRDKEIPLAGGSAFKIPENVLIIGTMNTADRSIALVDFALRRRFAFFELAPEYELLRTWQDKRSFNATGLVAVLQEINKCIDNKHFHIGISFFMVDNLQERIENIWRLEIESYLEEYFFSQPEKTTDYQWDTIKDRILKDVGTTD